MHCPVCKSEALTDQQLEPQLPVKACGRCGGHWIDIDTFSRWRESAHQVNQEPFNLESLEDSQSALMCPVSGRLMQKYRISTATTHRLDYSASVGAVWLDGGEWQLLKSSGMALQLSQVVTEHWQRQLRADSATAKFKDIYTEKFGPETYQKISEMRSWLSEQPQNKDLLAYLNAADPYSARN